MKTNNMNNESVSAFADGEIDNAQLEAMMLECRQEQHLEAWDIYHQIGDILRSDEMAQNCSANFNKKLAAQLALEPTYFLPAAPGLHHRSQGIASDPTIQRSSRRRYARSSRLISGIAAGAAVLYFGGAYLVEGNGKNDATNGLTASMRQQVGSGLTLAKATQVAASNRVVVLRDPQIDAYLIAHQQFSPSLYSTAQFARAASFANDSAK